MIAFKVLQSKDTFSDTFSDPDYTTSEFRLTDCISTQIQFWNRPEPIVLKSFLFFFAAIPLKFALLALPILLIICSVFNQLEAQSM